MVAYKQEGHTFKQLKEALGILLKRIMTGTKKFTAGISSGATGETADDFKRGNHFELVTIGCVGGVCFFWGGRG